MPEIAYNKLKFSGEFCEYE